MDGRNDEPIRAQKETWKGNYKASLIFFSSHLKSSVEEQKGLNQISDSMMKQNIRYKM